MVRKTGKTENGNKRTALKNGSDAVASWAEVKGSTKEKTQTSLQSTKMLLYDNFKYRIEVVPDSRAKRHRSGDAGGQTAPPKRMKCVLIESFMGKELKVGSVEGWRMNALLDVDKHFSESDNRERGYRLFLAMKLMQTVNKSRARYAIEVLKGLTLEETIFWVWQYHSYGKRALGALKHIHLR